MKDDLVLVLFDLHGNLEQLGDNRRRLRLRQRGMLQCLRSQLLVQDIGGGMQQQRMQLARKLVQEVRSAARSSLRCLI